MGWLISTTFLCLLATALAASAKSDHDADVVDLPGLTAAARVTRDAEGIAHIRASSKHDLFFMQGYVHAEDRLFQMDVTRRTASGTLAVLLGAGALESDVQLRTLGLRRAAQRTLAANALTPETLSALEAYAAGVNAWVQSHPLPVEYGAVEITQFVPWSVLDSVIVGKLVTFQLSFSLADIDRTIALQSYQVAGDALGFDGAALFFEDLWRSAPFEAVATVPDAQAAWPGKKPGKKPARPRDKARYQEFRQRHEPAVDLARRYAKKARKVPLLRRKLERDGSEGSNEWVVAGSLTKRGRPLLANDPHLSLGVPTTFYPNHLTGPGIDVYGNSFAGAPFVIVGFNKRIAWGATVNPMDATDVYQEQLVPDPNSPSGLSTLFQGQPEPVIPVPELFLFNQFDGVPDNPAEAAPGDTVAGVFIPPATLIVPRRNNGPIIQLDSATGVALSVQYTGWGPTRELDTFRLWNSARGLDDFTAGLEHYDFGSVNWAYADVASIIAYFMSAKAPLREDLQALTVTGLPPYFIRNGQGGNEWVSGKPGSVHSFAFIPLEEMPSLINPARGFFVNANNDPTGATLDNDPLNQLRPGGNGIFYLEYSYYAGMRAKRIDQRLSTLLGSGNRWHQGQRKVSFEDMQDIQADTVMRDAEVFVPYLVRALRSAKAADSGSPLEVFATDPEIREAVARLRRWDGSTPTGLLEGFDASDEDGKLEPPKRAEISHSVAATIYSVWRSRLIASVIDAPLQNFEQLLPFELPKAGDEDALKALRHLLDNFANQQGIGGSGIDFFAAGGTGDSAANRDIILLASLRAALDLLAGPEFAAAFGQSTAQDDYRWGLLHRITFESVLGAPFDIPPAGGAFSQQPLGAGLPGIATDGGFDTVDAARHAARADCAQREIEGCELDFQFRNGPVNRFVAQLNGPRRIDAESVWPGGVSGVLGSPYYVNQLDLWLTNDTFPLLARPSEIKRNAASDTIFLP